MHTEVISMTATTGSATCVTLDSGINTIAIANTLLPLQKVE